MIRQLRNLFVRYADKRALITKKGMPLFRPDGTLAGQVDLLTAQGGYLQVDGWADAQSVILSQNREQTKTRPDLPREDVKQVQETVRTSRPGFALILPYRDGPVALALETGADVQVFALAAFSPAEMRKIRRRHLWSFALRALWAVPLVARYKLSRNPAQGAQLRQKIKQRLDLQTGESGHTEALNAELIGQARSAQPELGHCEITIILPIYNAFELVKECLDRVLRHTDLNWHLVAIEDCSTDPAVRPWLKDWVARTNADTSGRVTLIENAQNRGFIGSVNSGFDVALTRGNPVVLLNSDALVPKNWASRLIAPLLNEPNAASVTPMSNDAEIFGAPVMCVPVTLEPGEADLMDQTAATLTGTGHVVEAPTGVGFCMAMHIDYLRMCPQFDTAFGRGYGEEVDWCQKVRAEGGRNLGLASLYVEHRGGQSFGNAEKLKSIAAASQIVANRYESYDADVQGFVHSDPLHTPRLALALAWLAARAEAKNQKLPIYMAHDMGGGAEHYLQRRIADDMASKGPFTGDIYAEGAVILRVGGVQRFQLEVYTPAGMVSGHTEDFALVKRLLASVPTLHLVYSNGVGDPDPVALPGFLLSLKREGVDSVEVLVHDFFPISPSFNLLNANNRFEGVPEASNRSAAHEIYRPDGTLVTLADWRDAWRPLLETADEVRVFSKDGATHVRAAYPRVTPNVVPHTLGKLPSHVPAPQTKAPVIGILGNIGLPKGASVLKALGGVVDKGGLVLIGNIDPAYDPGPNVTVHGDYKPSEIEALTRTYAISCWLIPSICPETFSYTTQECLATGRPVWCFDLGAQAEAVRRATDQGAQGGVIPLDWIDAPHKVMERLTADTTR